MSVWWVNHGQSHDDEIKGGFIWSPKTQKGGKFSQFYKNMTLVKPGDKIVSYADGLVSDIGIATTSAVSVAIPESHRRRKESDWDSDGWYISVCWIHLANAVAPKSILQELVQFFPEKHAPLKAKTGDGNLAYLSHVKSGALDLILERAGQNESDRVTTHSKSIVFNGSEQTVDNALEDQILRDPNLDATTRENLVKARVGQGIFKSNLAKIEQKCRLTSVDTSSLLTASHIKPWRSCSTSHERLDGNNGLLLTPNADRLFDRGMISFKDDGEVLVKDEVSDGDLSRLGLPGLRGRNVGAFTPEQQGYLKFHRELNGF